MAVSCPCFISSVLINLLVQEACCPLRHVTFLCISRLSSFTWLSQCKDDRKTGGHGCVGGSVMDTVSPASEGNSLLPCALRGPCCRGLGPCAGGGAEEDHAADCGAGKRCVTLHQPWPPWRAAGSVGCFPLPGAVLTGPAGPQSCAVRWEVETPVLCQCWGWELGLVFGHSLFFPNKRACLLPVELHLARCSQWLSGSWWQHQKPRLRLSLSEVVSVIKQLLKCHWCFSEAGEHSPALRKVLTGCGHGSPCLVPPQPAGRCPRASPLCAPWWVWWSCGVAVGLLIHNLWGCLVLSRAGWGMPPPPTSFCWPRRRSPGLGGNSEWA